MCKHSGVEGLWCKNFPCKCFCVKGFYCWCKIFSKPVLFKTSGVKGVWCTFWCKKSFVSNVSAVKAIWCKSVKCLLPMCVAVNGLHTWCVPWKMKSPGSRRSRRRHAQNPSTKPTCWNTEKRWRRRDAVNKTMVRLCTFSSQTLSFDIQSYRYFPNFRPLLTRYYLQCTVRINLIPALRSVELSPIRWLYIHDLPKSTALL